MPPSLIKTKLAQLGALYSQFQAEATPYLESIVCAPGCADCCTHVGSVDSTTLEGFAILTRLREAPPARLKEWEKRLKENVSLKKSSPFARCAFLNAQNQCDIYSVRPFSCRRLTSLKVCGPSSGPVVHRALWELAERTLTSILELDDTGYSGHMPYILKLLKDASFAKVYLAGEFAPHQIAPYAREHQLVINRIAARP